MKYLLFLLIILLSFFTILPLESQEHVSYKQYTANEGLSENNVLCMLQDKKGIMWFGTYDGINKFDGYSFKTFKGNRDGMVKMNNYRIDKIKEDADGYLWIQNYTGQTYRFNPATECMTPVPQCFKEFRDYKLSLKGLYTFKDGSIWITGGTHGDTDCFRITYILNSNDMRISHFNTVNHQLISNDVNLIYLDKQLNTWILTSGGVNLLKRNADKTIQPFKNKDRTEYFSLLETSSFIYLGGECGNLTCYNIKSGSSVSVKTSFKSSIVEIKRVNDNELFILSEKEGFGLYDLNKKSLKLYNKLNGCGLVSNNITGCYQDKSGNIWMDTDNPYIIYFDTKIGRVNMFNVSAYNSSTYKKGLHFFVIEDKENRTWVHSGNGVFCLYNRINNRLEPFYNQPGAPDRRFCGILRTAITDNQGNLWICPYSYGIVKVVFKKSPFLFYKPVTDPGFIEQNQIRAIYQDKEKLFWVSTMNGFLYLFDEHLKLLGRLGLDGNLNSRELFKFPVYGVLNSHDGAIWLSTKGGGVFKLVRKINTNVLSFSVNNYQYSKNDKYTLSSNDVYTTYEDRNHRLWFATFGGGINLLSGHDGSVRFINNRNQLRTFPEKCLKVRCITEDSKGRILLGTTNGLLMFRYNGENPADIKFKHFEQKHGTENSISGIDIQSVLSAKNGDLYLGTFGGGVNVIKGGLKDNVQPVFKIYKKGKGIPVDIVYTIQEDSGGNIWFSSQNKLVKFIPVNGEYEEYSPVAQSSYSFMEASGCKTCNGNFCYGTTDGFIVFNPCHIVKSNYVPKIIFTQLQIQNKPVDAGEKGGILERVIEETHNLVLSHKQDMISIVFSALDYTDPTEIKYAYKLEGVDADWNYAGSQRIATYTKLPKGKYIFKVKSTNADGKWVNNEHNISIEKLPSFWESSWGYVFYFILLVIVVFTISFILFTFYRLKNEVMVEHRISNLKLQFFTDISHELRTPLTLIASPVENIIRNEQVTTRVKEQLVLVQRNTERMLRLVNQILDFRKIQNKKMKLIIEKVAVGQFVQQICSSFNEFAQDRNIDFIFSDNSNESSLWVDKDKFEKIIFNLLSNAFKYTQQGKRIEVVLYETEKKVTIAVKDSGIGISKEKLSKIFIRFEALVPSGFAFQPSTGIGLSLTRELVELHKASIDVESEPGKGTVFNLSFQKGCTHFNNKEEYILQDFSDNKYVSNVKPGEVEFPDDAIPQQRSMEQDVPVVMVVEDNTELRHFLIGVLRDKYNVIEVENGKVALELLPENIPDLIISDIMMPEMSGLDLTKAVRKDINISHIPIVLLTAKNDIESKLEAMDYGVDDYITKPFSSVYLMSRIENLLNLRKQLQQLYCKTLTSGVISISKPNVTSQEDVFIQNILKYIESNIEDPELSIDNLALFVGLSRSSFFKKIKSLTGLPPVDFIKEIRIQRAAQLIESGNYNFSQISYMIGMNDSRYFSKCFKQKFGITPSEYKERKC